MSVAEKVAALFNALTSDEVQALPPAQRRRFADQCRHWADVAERPQGTAPSAGVLFDLGAGAPRHE